MPDLSSYKIPIVLGVNDAPVPPNFNDNGLGCNGAYFIDKYNSLVDDISSNLTYQSIDTSSTVSTWIVYGVDTSAGAVTLTLPVADQGDYIVFIDRAGNFEVNNLDIVPANGDTIAGAEGLTLNHNQECVTLLYDADVNNWIIKEALVLGGLDDSAPDMSKVTISDTDTTAGTLSDKLVAGSNVTLTRLNPGGYEQFRIAAASNDPNKIVNGTSEVDIPNVDGNIYFQVGDVQAGVITSDSIYLGVQAGTGGISTEGNVGLGESAAVNLSTGIRNTLIGSQAGSSVTAGSGNTGLGRAAAASVTVGENNIYLGYGAGDTTANNPLSLLTGSLSGSNNIVIGYGALPTAVGSSNEIVIGNGNHSYLTIPGVNFRLDSVSMAAAVSGQVLGYDGVAGQWGPVTVATAEELNLKADTSSLAAVATSGWYSDLFNLPTLGTASALNVGTGPNEIVQLDETGKLPSLDGSALINLPAGSVAINITTDTTNFNNNLSDTDTTVQAALETLDSITLGSAAALDVGTIANNVVQLDGTAKLPAIDGSQLINLPPGDLAVNITLDTTNFNNNLSGTDTTVQAALETLDNMEIAAYTEEALANKAPIDSPSFTGVPLAPTASAGTDTTQIATTAFVQEALSSTVSLTSGLVTVTGGVIDCSAGTDFYLNLTSNTVITLTNDTEDYYSIQLHIEQTGSYTVTWPSFITWGLLPPVIYTFNTVTLTKIGPGQWLGSIVNYSDYGEVLFSTPGSYTWTVPNNVSSISVLCIGGGGAGARGSTTAGGGAGGGLAYANNISVVPGEVYNLVVGAGGSSRSTDGNGSDGGYSRFRDSNDTVLLLASGGEGGSTTNMLRATIVEQNSGIKLNGEASGGDGIGGDSTYASTVCGAGGGAAGYTGNGGDGTWTIEGNPFRYPGSGGGGGGGVFSTTQGGGGGGTGIYGQGASGAAATSYGGYGGSGGEDASYQNGGDYGGGGGGTIGLNSGSGGKGVVRIIWPGSTRRFPSTNVEAS